MDRIQQGGESNFGIRALVLVPTRDLCEQVSEVFQRLTHYCPHLVRHIHIAGDVPLQTQKYLTPKSLSSSPSASHNFFFSDIVLLNCLIL